MTVLSAPPASYFQLLNNAYDKRHQELLQKHVHSQFDHLNRQYHISYERMSDKIRQRHRELLDVSSQYMQRNRSYMTDELIKQFEKDLLDSIRVLQEHHCMEVGPQVA